MRSAIARRGLTVIELLAATVISLIVMGATVQLFGTVGNQISNGRANIELGDRVRSAAERMQHDLRGATADMRPWNRPEDASGYLEIIKGPPSLWDKSASPVSSSTTPGATLTGYTNDAIFLTTRSRDLPFVGRAVNASGQNVSLESQVAEVAWFLQPTLLAPGSSSPSQTIPPTFTLYRRQLLVLPGVGSNIVGSSVPPSIPASQYYDSYAPSGTVPLCDISAHPDGNQPPNMVLNSLADLSYRENRLGHYFEPLSNAQTNNIWGNTATFGVAGGAAFPLYSAQTSNPMKPFPSTPANDPNLRYGEDVVLTNVLSFDVKVWDPWAQVLQDSKGNPMVPSDPGYSSGKPIGSGIYGAYVDLNWGSGMTVSNPSGVPAPYFAGGYYGSGQKSYLAPNTTSSLNSNALTTFPAIPALCSATYDLWSAGYESWLYNPTGANQPQSTNQSSNGFQNPPPGSTTNADGGVDGPNERLTSPPYPVPLRGIQIKIRTYEFTSKQVREVTIQESFVPD